MEIKEVDAEKEIKVLASLVYNTQVLSSVYNLISDEALRSPYSIKIVKRVLIHFQKYHKAPGRLIHDYIENRIQDSHGKEETKALNTILTQLKKYKSQVSSTKVDIKYLIDQTRSYLHQTKLDSFLTAAREAFDHGQTDKVEGLLTKMRVSVSKVGYVFDDPWQTDLASKVLREKETPLFTYNGALGQFYGNHLRRGNLVAFQGAEKSFKSFFLQEIAIKSLKEKLRVLFVGICDMNTNQYCRRLYTRMLYKPLYKQEYEYPVGWNPKNDRGLFLPIRQKRQVAQTVKMSELKKSLKRFQEKYLGTREVGKYYRMIAVGEISVTEIESLILQYRETEGWVPDVIVMDYADRLSPPKGVSDKLQQIDHNWNRLRDMGFQYDALVVTATQGKRNTYKGLFQTRDDVADQKTKTAIVTGLIGICATPEEFNSDTRRLNWIVCRDQPVSRFVTVASCPAICNPCVISC